MKKVRRKTLKHERVYIDGMTCINCQTRIWNALRSRTGITDVTVSYERSQAEFYYEPQQITLDEIRKLIEDLGYQMIPGEKFRRKRFCQAAGEIFVIAFLFLVLQHFGILNHLAPDSLAETGMGYGMLFVIGLITSVHCIAMCGGINLSQTLQKQEANAEEISRSMFRNTFSYNMGRVVSYTVIGGVLGAVGGLAGIGDSLQTSTVFQGSLKLLAGIIMVVMGGNMLGIFPGLRKLRIHISFSGRKSLWKKRTPFLVGLCNGFMPCGPLQSMEIVALASGSWASGAFSMFCFSLGTVPLMLGFGSIFSALGKKFTRQILKTGAILVVVMGLAMMSQGSALSGFGSRSGEKAATEADNVQDNDQTDTAVEKDGVQYVSSTLRSGRYPDITVKAGEPVKWEIQVPEGSINGCNYKMILQDFGMDHTFENGENVIEFIPEKEGVYTYSCWMGMITGTIYVTGVMLKMKKFMITGMVFLTAMTVLAGCGNATETTTTEEISTADENQEISVSSGGNLTIPVDELTENAAFYSVNVDGTEMEVMAVKTSDGTIRTAFNTCQICYDSGNGYYKQEGCISELMQH